MAVIVQTKTRQQSPNVLCTVLTFRTGYKLRSCRIHPLRGLQSGRSGDRRSRVGHNATPLAAIPWERRSPDRLGQWDGWGSCGPIGNEKTNHLALLDFQLLHFWSQFFQRVFHTKWKQFYFNSGRSPIPIFIPECYGGSSQVIYHHCINRFPRYLLNRPRRIDP